MSMSDYDRWITRTPPDYDDEPASAAEEAQGLVDRLADALDALCPDDATDAEVCFHMRACFTLERARVRLERRIAAAAAANYYDDGDHGDNDIPF